MKNKSSKPKFSFMVGVGQNTDRPLAPLSPLKPDASSIQANTEAVGSHTTTPFKPNAEKE
jgi:hypothetical protein